MRYCARCLYPENHPLHLTFDDEGVCSGCRVHEEKDRLDWPKRLEQLQRLVAGYQGKNRTIHDCVVPVSGGRDSYFIVHVVKRVLGLRPLLVAYNKQYNTPVGIRNLSYLRSLLGCDLMTMTVSPDRARRITRESLRRRGSIYWHCLAGQTAFPVQIAVKFKIPLIIWGAHQGVDQVGMFSHTDEVEMTRKYRKEHDLMGLEAEDLAAGAEHVREEDLEQYFYPHDKELEAVGVRGIYLNNYLRWDTKAQHELMIRSYGYETAPQLRTFDCYNDVDCFHYSGLHDWIKCAKLGYGKAVDHACREIRLKRLSREAGISLARKYEAVAPTDADLFLRWIGLSRTELDAAIEPHRDGRARAGSNPGARNSTESIACHGNDPAVEAARLPLTGRCDFIDAPSRGPLDSERKYILVGRGWADHPSLASKLP
ncbi:MAG TPA: N-acetyl sugar amidotransferase [Opitutaceae bacterium]|nr:N-acetyl sugar amidotransferase [Opitutaceae bacterium]